MHVARLAFLTLLARPLARFLTGADVIAAERLPKAARRSWSPITPATSTR